jgi:hypothetical protein
MLSLFSSGTKFQKYARQNNCSLVESNGYWLLYKDGVLVARERYACDAIQFLVGWTK